MEYGMDKKTVSLVLGSGGARGLTHIGVIRWLEENGYEIASISGTSIGALIGSIYAIGKLDQFEEWVCSLSKGDMLGLLDISLGVDGLIKGDKIMETIRAMVGDRYIEDLPIKFTAVASNISKRKEVWFQKGPMLDGVRASISLPLFFKPYPFNGDDLIDGGILNPVPIAPTFGDHTDYTVAVNLCAPHEEGAEIVAKKSSKSSNSGVTKTFTDFTDALTEKLTRRRTDIRAYDILYKSFDAMQGTIGRQKIAAYPPDCVINIPSNVCALMDFDRAPELIRFGHEKAGKTLSSTLCSL